MYEKENKRMFSLKVTIKHIKYLLLCTRIFPDKFYANLVL